MGFLPEAMRNYLLRLGWSHGDDEIIPTEKAVAWFDLEHVGRSPARFDMARLTNLNAHYLREMSDDELLPLLLPLVRERIGADLDQEGRTRVVQGLGGVKQRSRTVPELAGNLVFYAQSGPPVRDDKAAALLTAQARELLTRLAAVFVDPTTPWDEPSLEAAVKTVAEEAGMKLGQVAQPLRAALTGSTVSPGIFEVLRILGREESLVRIRSAAHAA
jgi:glutamyl-tRNA synthetase